MFVVGTRSVASEIFSRLLLTLFPSSWLLGRSKIFLKEEHRRTLINLKATVNADLLFFFFLCNRQHVH